MTADRGTLYVVSTPIGNLGDMTIRAVETLRACDRLLAEDTRRTRQLLSHLGITGKPVDRVDAHAGERDLTRAIERLIAGESVALVTDAGTPSVSDPGSALVRAAIEADIRIVPIPGATAALAALVGSGLAQDNAFRFLGFLPRHGRSRREALTRVAATPEPVVLFEAPGRVRTTLKDLAGATPTRPACIARELTKLHEELVRGTCESLAAIERTWIGEVAIVLGAHQPTSGAAPPLDEVELDQRIDEALARGEHPRTTAQKLAEWSGRPKRLVYERVLARKLARLADEPQDEPEVP